MYTSSISLLLLSIPLTLAVPTKRDVSIVIVAALALNNALADQVCNMATDTFLAASLLGIKTTVPDCTSFTTSPIASKDPYSSPGLAITPEVVAPALIPSPLSSTTSTASATSSSFITITSTLFSTGIPTNYGVGIVTTASLSNSTPIVTSSSTSSTTTSTTSTSTITPAVVIKPVIQNAADSGTSSNATTTSSTTTTTTTTTHSKSAPIPTFTSSGVIQLKIFAVPNTPYFMNGLGVPVTSNLVDSAETFNILSSGPKCSSLNNTSFTLNNPITSRVSPLITQVWLGMNLDSHGVPITSTLQYFNAPAPETSIWTIDCKTGALSILTNAALCFSIGHVEAVEPGVLSAGCPMDSSTKISLTFIPDSSSPLFLG